MDDTELKMFVYDCVTTKDGEYTIADGLFCIAKQIEQSFSELGNRNASTPFGAIEAHGMAVMQAGDKISDAINNLADAIRSSK